MGYTSMTDDEVGRFLRDPVRPGLLATVRSDGRPHLAPIWFDVDDDGTIVFNTGEDTVKGRNLRREGRAALCVQDDQPPFSFVTVEGPVAISDELDDVRPWAARIGGRYLGVDQAEAMGERNGVPGELVVRLTPAKVVATRDVAL